MNKFIPPNILISPSYKSKTQDHALLEVGKEGFNIFFKREDPWRIEKKGVEKLRYEITLGKIKKLLKVNDRILELGCAEGNFSKYLTYYVVDAVDISTIAVQRAKKLAFKNCKFYSDDILNFIRENDISKYNLILLLEILYYLNKERQKFFLEVLSKKINPKTFLFISVPIDENDDFFFTHKNLIELLEGYEFKFVDSEIVTIKGVLGALIKFIPTLNFQKIYINLLGKINKRLINQVLFIFKK